MRFSTTHSTTVAVGTTLCGCLLFLFNWVSLSWAIEHEPRVWTSIQGTPLEATYQSQTETDVTLQKADGSQLKVPKEKLSVQDQILLRDIATTERAEAAAARAEAKKKAAKENSTPPDNETSPVQPPVKKPTKPTSKNPGEFGFDEGSGDSGPSKKDLARNSAGKKPNFKNSEFDFDESFDPTRPGKKFTNKIIPGVPDDPSYQLEAEVAAMLTEQAEQPRLKFVHELKLDTKPQELIISPISDDGEFVAIYAREEKQLQVWNIITGKKLNGWACEPPQFPRTIQVSIKGELVSCATPEGVLNVYKVADGKVLYDHKASKNAGQQPVVARFDYSGKWILAFTNRAVLHCYPVGGGHGFTHEQKFEIDEKTLAPDVMQISISPDGRHIGYLTYDPELAGQAMNGPQNFNTGVIAQMYKWVLFSKPEIGAMGKIEAPKQDVTVTSTVAPISTSTAVNQGSMFNRLGKFSNVRFAVFPAEDKPDQNMLETSDVGNYSRCLVWSQTSIDTQHTFLYASGKSRLNNTNLLEVYDLKYADRPFSLYLPSVPGILKQDYRVGSQTRAVLHICHISQTDGMRLRVHQLTAQPQLVAWKFPQTVRQWFKEHRYDRLEKLAQLWSRDEQPIKSMDPHRKLTYLIEILEEAWGDQSTAERMREFMNWHRAHPQHDLPRILVARILKKLGWLFRGSGNAGTVTEEGWKMFFNCGLLAAVTLQPALKKSQPIPEAFLAQLEVHIMLGAGKEDLMELAEQVKQKCPEYFPFHQMMVFYLLPRWHGDGGTAEQYAASIANHLGPDKGDMQYAWMAIRLCGVAMRDVQQTERFDYDRVQRGIEKFCEQKPDSMYVRTLWYVWSGMGQYIFGRRDVDQEKFKSFVRQGSELSLANVAIDALNLFPRFQIRFPFSDAK